MKASDILALSKAGYNSQQIATIMQGLIEEEKNPQTDPAPVKQPEDPKQDPAPVKQPEDPKPDPAPAKQPEGYAGILAELEKLNQNIYAANIRNSNQPEEQSADDIIAEIIRPTKTNNQGGN